jgi:hypothetical protein
MVVLMGDTVTTRQMAEMESGLTGEGRMNWLIQRFTIPFS